MYRHRRGAQQDVSGAFRPQFARGRPHATVGGVPKPRRAPCGSRCCDGGSARRPRDRQQAPGAHGRRAECARARVGALRTATARLSRGSADVSRNLTFPG